MCGAADCGHCFPGRALAGVADLCAEDVIDELMAGPPKPSTSFDELRESLAAMTARAKYAEWLAGSRGLHIVHLRKQRDSARRTAEKAETEVARLGKALTATRALRDEAETERDEWSAEAFRLRDWGDAQARAANSSDKTVERLVGERDEAVRLLKVANAEAAGGSHD